MKKLQPAKDKTSMRKVRKGTALILGLCSLVLTAQPPGVKEPRLPQQQLAANYFDADAPWYLHNIPFLEIDDPEIQQIYYYRWQLLRAHLREIGPQGTTVLEFLDNVPWARQPYTDLNDSASFHILESRWLRNATVVNNLIDHLYSGGANDRHFSESIAAATESSTLVTGDARPALRHLDTMQHIFNLWDDHFDRSRNLYWVEPLLDATEYTISSIDASGAGFSDTPSKDQNHNGFIGGFSYRPSINSYQYANARAIARLAIQANKPDVAADYAERAERIRSATLSELWNPELQHFTDRYQRSTPFAAAGAFIRGRELVGYVPWTFELPPLDEASATTPYSTAWKHVLSSQELAGPDGLRTVEPSYPRYLTQYRYDQTTGLPECQWNGPSWPFQTSQALTGLANLLDDYAPAGITKTDYLHLLRQYTHQHFLSPGHPDIQEDYNPDTGKPVVGLPRSHHYFHSTYVDLILSGLIGIRPRADDTLELNPLVPTDNSSTEQPIHYFALQDAIYHGHDIGIFYDNDGSRYHIGRGLSIFVDGQRVFGPGPIGRIRIPLPRHAPSQLRKIRIDLAVNPGFSEGPAAAASSANDPSNVDQAIDGRLWFFPEVPNGWSPDASESGATSWYSVDFRQTRVLGSIELYFFSHGETYKPPPAFRLQFQTSTGWQDVPKQQRTPQQPIANGENLVVFPAVRAKRLRVLFVNPTAPSRLRLIEIEAFAP